MPAEDPKVLPLDPGPLVLVVDDEPTPRSLITRMARSLGYRARSRPSGRAGLRFLQSHPREVRLLLADLGMPQMDGGELAERAKDLDPSLLVMLMADPRDPTLDGLVSAYRDAPFLPKPVGFGDLAEKLERLLGIPTGPTSPPPSMVKRTRRRPSGRHQS